MRGKSKVFTEEEVNYIISNWGKESAHSMKKRFNCTWYAVCKVAESHGLEMPTSSNWTKEEIKKLEELSKDYHISEIAQIMGRTENAVFLKAKRLGITLIQDRRSWTKEEETMLSDLWGTISIESLAKKMKRSVFSLKVKAVRMGLGSMIKNNYDVITVSDLSDLLSVSRDRITTTWVFLGLNLKKKKLTKKRSYYVISWEDLIKFLEQNQNEWDSRNIEENMLGPEPEWLKEKRARDKVENPLWYRLWTKDEIIEAERLFKEDKDYIEIGALINRSPFAVAYLLRKRGYSYKMPYFWQGKELKFLKDNYKTMTYEEIATVLGRTTKAVSAKAEELGYSKKLVRKKSDGEFHG